MPTEVLKPLANENATDRNPWDMLSPDADASVNPHDPEDLGTLDDAVDITSEYDDSKAQAIESKLEPVIDVDEPSINVEYVKINDLENVQHMIARCKDEREVYDAKGKTKEIEELNYMIEVLHAVEFALKQPEHQDSSAEEVIKELAQYYTTEAENQQDANNQILANAFARSAVAASNLAENYGNMKAQHEMTITPKGYHAPDPSQPRESLPGDVIS